MAAALDLGKTNFMDPQLPPAFLYYNPWLEEKRVTVVADLKQGRVHDLTRRKLVEPQRGKWSCVCSRSRLE